MSRAQGNFTVDIHPLAPAPAEGIGRFSINKTIHGDLEATTIGEIFNGGDPKQGAAGYVAIEFVCGNLLNGSTEASRFNTLPPWMEKGQACR